MVVSSAAAVPRLRRRPLQHGLVYVEAVVILPVVLWLCVGLIDIASAAAVRIEVERLWHAIILLPRHGKHDDWIHRVERLMTDEGATCVHQRRRLVCHLPGGGGVQADTAPGRVTARVERCVRQNVCAVRERTWFGLTAPGGLL